MHPNEFYLDVKQNGRVQKDIQKILSYQLALASVEKHPFKILVECT